MLLDVHHFVALASRVLTTTEIRSSSVKGSVCQPCWWSSLINLNCALYLTRVLPTGSVEKTGSTHTRIGAPDPTASRDDSRIRCFQPRISSFSFARCFSRRLAMRWKVLPLLDGRFAAADDAANFRGEAPCEKLLTEPAASAPQLLPPPPLLSPPQRRRGQRRGHRRGLVEARVCRRQLWSHGMLRATSLRPTTGPCENSVAVVSVVWASFVTGRQATSGFARQ
mmetsp:Transcript_847/g.1911  ORF Transcript_847/g.1911 Transcript_847/m.1911 type:complete len:224 (+) Transcript_847:125-796(+)